VYLYARMGEGVQKVFAVQQGRGDEKCDFIA